jgi:hypothetical protein
MTHSLPFGTIVKIAFPFTDLAVTKSAPAVVVSSERYHYERADVVLVRFPETGAASVSRPGNLPLQGFFFRNASGSLSKATLSSLEQK